MLYEVITLADRQESGKRFTLSAQATRSLLDSLSDRLEESRDISKYFIGLSIFLGLLGTFWGLLDTVRAIGRASTLRLSLKSALNQS